MKGLISMGILHLIGIGLLLFTLLEAANAAVPLLVEKADPELKNNGEGNPTSLDAKIVRIRRVTTNGGLKCASCEDPWSNESRYLKTLTRRDIVPKSLLVDTSNAFCYRCIRGEGLESMMDPPTIFGCINQDGIILGQNGSQISGVPDTKINTPHGSIAFQQVGKKIYRVRECDFDYCNFGTGPMEILQPKLQNGNNF